MALIDGLVRSQGETSVTVGGSMAGWELALLIGVVGAVAVGFVWPLTSAWARRIAGKPLDERLLRTQDQLDQALDRLSRAEGRVEELEQRLDFAERLLPTPATPAVPTIAEATRQLPNPPGR